MLKKVFKRRKNMNVKHIPTNEVHKGNKCMITGCGLDTELSLKDWVNTAAKITCKNKGCKN